MRRKTLCRAETAKSPTGCPYPNYQNGAKREQEIRITERGLHRARWQNALPHSGTEGFKYVGIGQLGGYIEKEENLSHEGEAWVFDNARVFGDARVFGNARVFSSTQVYGDAWVYDNARVFGDARVSGNAW